MKLEGIHHVTCITGDILKNVDFYTRILGLRLVAKSVNQDDPSVYHVFYSDEQGAPGADLTFFEYKHAARGRPGPGMVHRVMWRVGSTDALAAWLERLRDHEVSSTPIIDRYFFHSIYFREPSGVLFEIADDAPGFGRGGDPEHLGATLSLPPWLEDRRAEIEARLTPIPDPR